MRIRVVYNEQRYHKIKPLLRDQNVVLIKNLSDVFREVARYDSEGVVMIESFGRFALLGLIAYLFLGAKFVVRVRGDVIEVNRDRLRSTYSILGKARLQFGELLIRTCLRNCDAVAYNSQDVRNKLEGYVQNDACEEVVYNPFTEDCPSESSSAADLPAVGLHLLTVTNMDFEGKALPTLTAITKWMSPEMWEELDIHWIVLGRGGYLERVRQVIRHHDLEGRVSLPGWVHNPFPYYEWCEVYVHMTRLDGFPNATMEAMSRTCPIITNTKSCGVREQVIDGENGHVVDSRAEFRQRLKEYASYPERRHEHGSVGQHLVKTRWTIENQKERMNCLLDCVSKKNK